MRTTRIPQFDLKKPGQTADTKKEVKLRKACKDFEAIMIKQLLTSMRKSVPKDGLFNSGYSEDMYQSMYDDELAKSLAGGKGLGLAAAMYDQITQGPNSKITQEQR